MALWGHGAWEAVFDYLNHENYNISYLTKFSMRASFQLMPGT